MKIAVAGVGYVGLSLAVLLSQHNEVCAVSTTPAKVEMINSGKSPIKDKEIEEYLSHKLNLTATTDRRARTVTQSSSSSRPRRTTTPTRIILTPPALRMLSASSWM